MLKIPALVFVMFTNFAAAIAFAVAPQEAPQHIQNSTTPGANGLVNWVIADRVDDAGSIPAASTTTLAPRSDDENQRCPRFEPLFEKYGLKPVDIFSYIAYRESRCRIKAINARFDENGNVTWTLNKDGSIDRGLLQINSSWKTVTKNVCGTDVDGLLVLDCNLRVAKYLLDNGGLAHWRMSLP